MTKEQDNKSVWHNLRTKPEPYRMLLVETFSKHYHYRICFYLDNGLWRDAYKTSYYLSKSCKSPVKNDFRVKRWAYIDNIK